MFVPIRRDGVEHLWQEPSVPPGTRRGKATALNQPPRFQLVGGGQGWRGVRRSPEGGFHWLNPGQEAVV